MTDNLPLVKNAFALPTISELRACPETRPLNGRIEWEGEAPAEPHAEQAGPVC